MNCVLWPPKTNLLGNVPRVIATRPPVAKQRNADLIVYRMFASIGSFHGVLEIRPLWIRSRDRSRIEGSPKAAQQIGADVEQPSQCILDRLELLIAGFDRNSMLVRKWRRAGI